VFTDRERAALAWPEAVTLVANTHVPDDIYDMAREAISVE
jgi:alkylhydroperoxidase family enzyme